MFERNNEKETKLNPIIKIGTVFALSAAALTGCATANAEGPVSTPSASSSEVTPSPTETESAPATLEFNNPENFVFPATATPEDLANLYVKFSIEENSAYATPGVVDYVKGKGNIQFDKLATKHLTDLYNVVAVPNWQDVPGLQKTFQINETIDAANMANYLNNTAGTLDFSYSLDNYEIHKQTDQQIIIRVYTTEHYASTWSKDNNESKYNGDKTSEIITFQKSGDKWLLADWSAES